MWRSDGTLTRRRVCVAYRYGDQDEILEVRLDQGSPAYRVGQEVSVLIDPDDPSVRGLPGEDDSSVVVIAGFSVLLLVGIGGLGTGIGGLARVRRLRRLLRDHPWRTFTSRYVERPGLRSSVYQGLVLETSAGPRVLQFAGGWTDPQRPRSPLTPRTSGLGQARRRGPRCARWQRPGCCRPPPVDHRDRVEIRP